MKYLIGKEILRYKLDGDTILTFYLKSGETVVYEAEGDCCSESFFHSITGIAFLHDCKVIKVIEKKEKKADESYQEEDILYGYDLIVEGKAGTQSVEIEFRNSSNGYYGGYLEEKINYCNLTGNKLNGN